jgi:hypothetical protein
MTTQKHIVSAEPEGRVISHRIEYTPPPNDIHDRRRLATLGETYLRQWGEKRKELLRLDTKKVKITIDERMITSSTPSLYGINATWPTAMDADYLKQMKNFSEELNGYGA